MSGKKKRTVKAKYAVLLAVRLPVIVKVLAEDKKKAVAVALNQIHERLEELGRPGNWRKDGSLRPVDLGHIWVGGRAPFDAFKKECEPDVTVCVCVSDEDG